MKSADHEELGADVADAAGGSAIVLFGWMADRGVSLGVVVLLAWWLGVHDYGVYVGAMTILMVVTTFAPLGLHGGTILFTSRYLASGERDRLGGVLKAALVVAAIGGSLGSLGVAAAAWFLRDWIGEPTVATALLHGAPMVAFFTLAQVLQATLQGSKAMVQATVGRNLIRPLAFVGLLCLFLALDGGVLGAMWALVLSHMVDVVVTGSFAVRRFGRTAWASSRPAWREAGPLMGASVPLVLGDVALRLNLSLDLLVLLWLAVPSDVGVYRVAVAIALVGSLPVAASIAMFKPIVGELHYTRQHERLGSLLRAASRWMLALIAPAYVAVAFVPDLVLLPFGTDFSAAAPALVILLAGQLVHLAWALTTPLLMMSNHRWLNVANGVVTIGVNLALNLWFIPMWGLVGAAAASAIASVLWALLRVVQSVYIARCSPLSFAGAVVLTASLGLVAVAAWFTPDQPLVTRTILAVVGGAVVAAVAWALFRTDEDRAIGRIALGRVRGAMDRVRRQLPRSAASSQEA